MLQTALIEPNGTDRVFQSQPCRPLHVGQRGNGTKWIVVPIIDLQTPQHKAAKFEVIDRGHLRLVREYPLPSESTPSSVVLRQDVYWFWRPTVAYDIAAGTLVPLRAVLRSCGPPYRHRCSNAQHGATSVDGQSRTRSRRARVHRTCTDGQPYAWLGGSAIAGTTSRPATVVVKGFPPEST